MSRPLSSNGIAQGEQRTGQGIRRTPPIRKGSYAVSVPASTPLDSEFHPLDGLSRSAKEYATPQHLHLTPLRAHYLKRELVGGQLATELHALASPDALSIVGWPFEDSRKPKDTLLSGGSAAAAIDNDEETDLPFLRFFLHHFVMTFPFLSQVDMRVFYSKKLQPFIESFMARNISMNDEREEETGHSTKRHKLAGKAEKHLGLLISSAVRLSDNNGREEVVRIVDVKSAPVPTLPTGSPSIPTTDQSGLHKAHESAFQVNVICVRTIVIRSKIGIKSKHEEFIVRTSRLGAPSIFVSRRYGDFAKLSDMLRSEYPELDIRAPPPKDRRGVDAGATTGASASTADSDSHSLSDTHDTVILSRERNRLTLRAYLRLLLQTEEIANSPTLQAFLTQETTTLNAAEEADAARREEMDRLREAETDKFRSEVEGRVKELERHLRSFKDELVKKDGLSKVFATIRITKDYKDLPVEYQRVMEWARISLASTIYQLFLGSDNSSAIFGQFKRVNGIMPYFMMRQILKISNPVAMIRAGLDLFLARPFGSASLLQRMFSSGVEGEVKELKEDMLKVQEKIADDTLCERIKRFINAPRDIQKRYRDEATSENLDILTVILRAREDYPPLSPQSFQRIHRASIKHREYLDWVATLQDPDDEDEGPDNDDAWLFEDLHVLMRMQMRLRDKEQILEMIFEGSTSDLLKDIITIFYEPLAKVYKAANIGDSLYDLQMFITDLIKTVESAEVNVTSTNIDPQRTVTVFMDLVARHEGAFYNFVHQVHNKGEDLFDGLMRWIELFLNFIREGLNPEGITLDFLLPHAGKQREDVMKEIDSIIEYHRTLKIAHHERLRRRLIKGEVSGAASYVTGSGVVGSPGQVGFGAAPDKEQDAAFIDGVLQNLSMSGVADDIDDLNAEEDEDSEEDGDNISDEFVDADDSPELGGPSSSSHSQPMSNQPSTNNPYAAYKQPHAPNPESSRPNQTNNPFSSFMTQTTLVVNLPPPQAGSTGKQGTTATGKKGGKRAKATVIVEPDLVHIPKLVPVFTEMLKPSLETAQRIQMLKAQQQLQKSGKGTQAAQAAIRK